MDNIFYVYELVDPRTNLPFYIGKGKNNRCEKHLDETYKNTENKKKYAYIKGLKNKGLIPVINKIAIELLEEDAYNLEAELIALYGRKGIDKNGILTNICVDNRPPHIPGFKHSEKTKELLRSMRLGENNPMYGRHLTEQQKMYLSTLFSGEGNPFFDKKHTAESRVKMQEHHGGTGMLGKQHSAETKEILRQKSTGRTHTKETKEKLGALWKGKKHTPESIERMRIAKAEWWRKRKSNV